MATLVAISEPAQKLVDAKQLAEFLSFDARVIRRMAKARKIPCLVIKNGGREYYRFRLHEVEEALRGEK